MVHTQSSCAALVCMAVLGFAPLVFAQPEASKDEDYLRLIIDGDQINYSADRKNVTLRDNVTVVVQAPGTTEESLTIKAQEVHADLDRGIVTIDGGGAMAIGPGVLRGEKLIVDAGRQEFTLTGAEGYFALPPPAEYPESKPALIYFRARRMEKVGNLAILHHCRLTTCPHAEPDYFVRADRVRYNIVSRVLRVDRAEIEMYGIEVPLLPWFEAELGGPGGGSR